VPNRAGGLGLLGLRERAANAGGTVVIDSAPGQGTRIALRVPVRPVETDQAARERKVNV
jgi:signal transduction histidine kinase